MQIALTPFPKGVDVKQFLQDRKRGQKDRQPLLQLQKIRRTWGGGRGGIPLLVGVTGAGDDAPESEHMTTIQCARIVSDPVGSVVSTEKHIQQLPF
jgi:hypothetical protein